MPEWMWYLSFGVPAVTGVLLWSRRTRHEDEQLPIAIGGGIATGLSLAVAIFLPDVGIFDVTVAYQLDGMIFFGFLVLLSVDVVVTTILSSYKRRGVFYNPRWFKHYFWLVASLAGIGLGQKWWMVWPCVALLAVSFMQVFFPPELIIDIRKDRQRRIEEEDRRH